jgi:thiol-disulfide isomerase/thioredoxin
MKQIDRMLLVILAVVAALATTNTASAADTPKDQIVAMYFHRTERCPTCKKMGAYSEEAIKTAFAKELKEGTVRFLYIDFQDPKNAKWAKGYKIEGPSLIVAKIVNNRVAAYKNLDGIWERVTDKPVFLKYVQDNVAAYQE